MYFMRKKDGSLIKLHIFYHGNTLVTYMSPTFSVGHMYVTSNTLHRTLKRDCHRFADQELVHMVKC